MPKPRSTHGMASAITAGTLLDSPPVAGVQIKIAMRLTVTTVIKQASSPKLQPNPDRLPVSVLPVACVPVTQRYTIIS